MASQPQTPKVRATVATPTGLRYRRPASPAEHAKRQAWGRKTGAAVAAAYRERLRAEGEG